MESKIRVLSEQTINQIAAGEVIENPASVVKELVENAIDAESTDICVEIIAGGRTLIRVSDNGFGMNADDAVLCLERHATSKIKDVDDIQSVMTMGFRGEAIPSIASISKFSILTSAKGEETGTWVLVEGGRLLQCSKAVRSPGTTIEIQSLFFNVPVRRKFQKSPNYDTNEILKVLTIIALGNPNIKFELISNEKKILSCPKSNNETLIDNLKSRIKSLLGPDFLELTFPVSESLDGFQLEGFIGCPSANRQNRTGQYLFINKRAVQSPLISYAVRDGYGTALPTNRHPVYVLHLTIPGDLIDVNVHPQKREVRLRQEQSLKALVVKAIEKALQNSAFFNVETSKEESFPFGQYRAVVPQFSLTHKFQEFSFKRENEEIEQESIEPARHHPENYKLEPKLDLQPVVQPLLFEKEECFKSVDILTTIPQFILIDPNSFKTTAQFLKKEETLLCLVDQRLAHSRIIFEKISAPQEIPVQSLLIPYTFETSATESLNVLEQIDFLTQMGVQIHQSGPKTFTVDAIPAFFGNSDVQLFINDLLQQLKEFQNGNAIQKEKEKRLAICASRAALSENKRLSIDEARLLIDQLMKCQMPYQCPRGKAIFASLTKNDLQNLF